MRGRDQKRSFVKHRSSNKSRHRLSEGEDPLDESHLIKQSSSTSLNLPRVRYNLSSSSSEVKLPSISDSPRMWKDLSPEISNDRAPTSSKVGKELSPQSQRMRNVLSPDPYRLEKTVSPDLLHRERYNSDQWDCSIVSSQSESSVDILSGSCDSLDNVTMEIKKNTSPPIRRGESSAVKVSAVNKKQVIRNLASITSLTQVDEGEHNKDDKITDVEDKCSSCGPDVQVISSHDLASNDSSDVSHDLNGVSHDPTSVSHDPDGISMDDDLINQSVSMDSNISSQSFHVDFFDSPVQQHSLDDIAEEQNEVLNKKVQHMSIQSTASILSIGM